MHSCTPPRVWCSVVVIIQCRSAIQRFSPNKNNPIDSNQVKWNHTHQEKGSPNSQHPQQSFSFFLIQSRAWSPFINKNREKFTWPGPIVTWPKWKQKQIDKNKNQRRIKKESEETKSLDRSQKNPKCRSIDFCRAQLLTKLLPPSSNLWYSQTFSSPDKNRSSAKL